MERLAKLLCLVIFFLVLCNAKINYLSQALHAKKDGKLELAYEYIEKATEENPNSVNVLIIKGQILVKLERNKEAITVFEKLHATFPENTVITQQLANLYQLEDRLRESIKLNLSLVKKRKTSAGLFYNLGFALNHLGLKKEAITFYRQALELKPDCIPARIGLGSCLVTIGQFEEGWKEVSWPLFRGKQLNPHNFLGKTVLLDCRNPYGDTFFFIRYAQQLKECGARVLAHVPIQLVSLLSLMPCIDQVFTQRNKISYDIRIPVTSCGYIFNTTLETIPTNVPYLYAQPSLINLWKEKLKNDTNFKIGICWSANAFNDRFIPKYSHRTFDPTRFKKICGIKNVSCYSLQTSEINKTLPKDLNVSHFENFDSDHGSFMDTAALITNLDLIITADTSIAHLAGALAKPVWVLLPHVADGRWLLDRQDSPWYPTMRLFRQKAYGYWQPVFEKVYQEVIKLIT